MKLDAIYLVAPKPKPPSMPTRRAFLIAGGTFATGALLGGACGYSIGAAAGPVGPAAAAAPGPEPDLVKSGDVELDELRRLAVKAPIEELVEHRILVSHAVQVTYRNDPFLWRGVERLVNELLAKRAIPDGRIFARFLAQAIEEGDATLTKPLRPRVVELRQYK